MVRSPGITRNALKLDTDALKAHGVRVLTTPGVNAVSVAEHALAMILSLAKRLPEAHTAVLASHDRAEMPVLPAQLRGRRAGVLGAGATARALLPMLSALGMGTSVWTRNPDAHPDLPVTREVEKLFSTSDVVSVRLPLTDSPRGFVCKRLVSMLPMGAVLVNTARKELFAPEALEYVAAERRDVQVAVDAFGLRLRSDGTADALGGSLPASPHIAGVTIKALRAMQDAAVRETIRTRVALSG